LYSLNWTKWLVTTEALASLYIYESRARYNEPRQLIYMFTQDSFTTETVTFKD
jgi:hypothetical protein